MGGHARRRASPASLIVGRRCCGSGTSRVAAYRWFERGILVQIFVTQVFEFAQQQLAGVFGLAFNLLLWVAIRSMIRAEVEQELVEREPVAS